MTVKEQIIRKTIKEINKRLEKIDFILDARPLSDLIKLEDETIKTAKKMTGEKAVEYIDQQIKKKNALLRLAKKQIGMTGLIDQKVKLMGELTILKNELYYIKLQGR
jgi:hypothetical protein